MSFSEKILMIRNKAGYSQDEMADRFGVSRQTVSKWENGLSYPEIDTIIKISETFHVSIDWLLKKETREQVKEGDLEKGCLQFLGVSQDMEKISELIIEIMRDGVIDDMEKVQLKKSISALEQVIENIKQIRDLILSDE